MIEVAGKILGGPESQALRDAIDVVFEQDCERLLIDLTHVPWVNSAGLGILLAAYSRMRDRGGEMRFCGVGQRVRGILKTTKLLTVMPCDADERSAIQKFEEAHPGGRSS
ncbi:MAG: STAS domain-containing protein [Gemmatimonadetes bacterium]|nr:STAS domain-containing protein [Gemmatimonadota bacterium]